MTLVMIDKFGEGVPLAYCLSEKNDEETITTFLECIKKLVGDIKAQEFLSDDASQYYNAWAKVFGGCRKRLCSWHVYRSWDRQLRSKVKGEKQQEEIMNELIEIRNSLDMDSAIKRLKQFIHRLKSKPATKEFGKYIESYYLRRTDEWIYCDRPVLVPNTNMHIESLHRLIKYVFLNSKRINRLSRCIEILEELTQEKELDCLVKNVKIRCNKKTRAIKEAHERAEKQIDEYDLCLFYEDDESGEKLYEVTNNREKGKKIKYRVIQKKLNNDHSCER